MIKFPDMKYHIWTEGCQMNVADSQRVASALERLGYGVASHPAEADVIVLNTCVVRQSAEDKAMGHLYSLKPLKKERPELVVNLMGCMVGVKGTESLQKRFPFVDVFGRWREDIDEGKALLEGIAAPDPDQAAHQVDHQSRVAGFERLERCQVADGLVLGALAHDAGVEHQHVGLRRAGGGPVAQALQGGSDPLRVGDVHLAAFGPNVIFHIQLL